MKPEPRNISRYRDFDSGTVRIHPLKRWAGRLARLVPKRWRFALFGLPARAEAIPGADSLLGPGVLKIPEGTASRIGAHLSRGGLYVPEATLGAGSFMETRLVQKQRFFPKVRPVEGRVVSLSSEGQVNYYRWLMETLPRVRFIREAALSFDWLYCYQERAFHRESIRLLNFDTGKIIPTETNKFIRAGELLVPGYVDESEPWVIPWLREQFLSRIPKGESPDGKSRIYITRRAATGRRITNESELLEKLRAFDFKVVSAEDLGFLEQVALFAGAGTVIAPHGAGLANLVFCSAPTLVLELIADDYPFTFYPEVSRRLGLEHHRISCRPVDLERVRMSDLEVDIEEIVRTLEQRQRSEPLGGVR